MPERQTVGSRVRTSRLLKGFLGIVTGFFFALGLLVIIGTLSGLVGASGTELTAWKLEAIAVIGWFLIGSSIATAVQFLRVQVRRTSVDSPRMIRRPNTGVLLAFQLGLVLAFYLLLRNDPTVQSALGMWQAWPLTYSIAIGLVAYVLVLLLYELGCVITGTREHMRREELRVMRLFWPRRLRARVPFLLAVCLLNPFTEEMLFRGILVPHLTEISDSVFLGAALALACSVVMHLYQGWRLIPFHVLFHGTAIALFLSPAGLVGAIAFHAVGDIWPFIGGTLLMRRRLKSLRARQAISRTSNRTVAHHHETVQAIANESKTGHTE